MEAVMEREAEAKAATATEANAKVEVKYVVIDPGLGNYRLGQVVAKSEFEQINASISWMERNRSIRLATPYEATQEFVSVDRPTNTARSVEEENIALETEKRSLLERCAELEADLAKAMATPPKDYDPQYQKGVQQLMGEKDKVILGLQNEVERLRNENVNLKNPPSSQKRHR